jgi:hypothetical protein
LIEIEVAPVTDQERVDELPEVIEEGLATKEEMVGAGIARVLKVKSGDEIEFPKASTEITLK